jgi:DNA-directed RNA polymerase subunit E'/Rpb7
MEHTALFEERASLTSRDLRGQITDIDALLLQKLSTRMENKCSRHGFVLPGTMKILSRSMGYIEKGRFTGDIIFHLQLEGKVLNPPAGTPVEGVVIRKNKMGMYVSYDDAIRIILPRDIHIGNDEFEAVNVGQRVKVEIQKSRFQVNDAYILSVGLFRGVADGVVAPLEGVEEVVEEGERAEEEAVEGVEEVVEEGEDAEEEALEGVEENSKSNNGSTVISNNGSTGTGKSNNGSTVGSTGTGKSNNGSSGTGKTNASTPTANAETS